MRTEQQCKERQCPGCVVCDRQRFTLEQLEDFRRTEALDELGQLGQEMGEYDK